MRADPIARFVQLHRQLTNEKRHLEERLARINQALASLSLDTPRSARVVPVTKRKNAMSLKEAIFRATRARPLTKPEIVEAVAALGYRFTGKDPMNAINVQLYTKGQFKREGRKFSPGPALNKPPSRGFGVPRSPSRGSAVPRPASTRRTSAKPASRGVRLKHKFRFN
jgi:hypothetical protein